MTDGRRGARSYATVAPEVLDSIERNEIDSATHVEQMAADMERLLRYVEPSLGTKAAEFRGKAFLRRLETGGEILFERYRGGAYTTNRSDYRDIARGWQAFAIKADTSLDVVRAVREGCRYAADPHFAVREWAWLAVRDRVVAGTSEALSEFEVLSRSADARVRRYCIEASRPRSVWGRHLEVLKIAPWRGEALLVSVANDDSPYVLRSAVNWLRDSEKHTPDWTKSFLESLPADWTLRKKYNHGR